MQQFWVSRAFFDQQRHRVLVSREKSQERRHPQRMRQSLNGGLLARESPTIDVDVKSWVLALDDDVHGSGHGWSVQKPLPRSRLAGDAADTRLRCPLCTSFSDFRAGASTLPTSVIDFGDLGIAA